MVLAELSNTSLLHIKVYISSLLFPCSTQTSRPCLLVVSFYVASCAFWIQGLSYLGLANPSRRFNVGLRPDLLPLPSLSDPSLQTLYRSFHLHVSSRSVDLSRCFLAAIVHHDPFGFAYKVVCTDAYH
jgi:hypothetical protein